MHHLRNLEGILRASVQVLQKELQPCLGLLEDEKTALLEASETTEQRQRELRRVKTELAAARETMLKLEHMSSSAQMDSRTKDKMVQERLQQVETLLERVQELERKLAAETSRCKALTVEVAEVRCSAAPPAWDVAESRTLIPETWNLKPETRNLGPNT